MNAIISLCHFCENHGPRVIFCTHPLRPKDTDNEEDDSPADVGHAADREKQLRSPTLQAAGSHDGQTPALSASRIRKTDRADTCEGCDSIHGGYVSRDEEAGVSYVSKRFPHHPLVFSMVRQACVRSLSCEVCPGREGPIFFGDEQRGHVLSYTFYIADSESRGLQRWYSILVIMMDKVYLLNSWPFLVPNVQLVIENVQAKAMRVYDAEQARCPQRPLRLQTSMTPANFRQKRGVSKSARSLVELTDDKNVFKMLHVAFTWIIKACGNRITETFLEGPPTEDSIIDMEKQEETEEGFIKLFSKKLSTSDSDDMAVDANDGAAQIVPPDVEGSQVQSIRLLRRIMTILGQNKFHVLAHHIVIGNQIIVKGDNRSLVTAILCAFKILLPRGCCRAIASSDCYQESWKCNLLGLPLSVRLPPHVGSTEPLVQLSLHDKPLVDATATNGTQEVSDEHEEQTKDASDLPNVNSANEGSEYQVQFSLMDGVDLDTVLTQQFKSDTEEHGHSPIAGKRALEGWRFVHGGEVPQRYETCADVLMSLDDGVDADILSGFEFVFTAPFKVPDKSPQLLNVMESALQNENLTNEVVEQCFICLKVEWMNKVKVLFKFTKAGGGRSEEDTKKLIQVVGAGNEDMQLLKFWMTGLSMQYRTHILSTSKKASGSI